MRSPRCRWRPCPGVFIERGLRKPGCGGTLPKYVDSIRAIDDRRLVKHVPRYGRWGAGKPLVGPARTVQPDPVHEEGFEGVTATEPSVALVRVLVREQFPEWADLEVTEVSSQGWDNRTFRLGSVMSVRLPSGAGYAPQVDTEHRWLPFLSRYLQTPIPTPLAKGAASPQFPWAWSVYRWLDGTPLEETPTGNLDTLAVDVAAFLRALQSIPTPADAPEPEQANGFRGAPFDRYVAEGQEAVRMLDESVQQRARIWLDQATESSWTSAPVWVHGDMAAGNLLLHDGRLGGVIDFGCMAVGDPACDLTMAWTIFDARSRGIFRDHVDQAPETWSRARGWALWKALITLRSAPPRSAKSRLAQRTLSELSGSAS